MPDEATPEGGRKPFAAFIREQRGGNLHSELSDALAGLVLAVIEHGKTGKLALEFVIEPNADGATVTISDKLKLNVPEANRGAAIFFVDEEGNLSRQNPRQMEMPLREVGDRKEKSG